MAHPHGLSHGCPCEHEPTQTQSSSSIYQQPTTPGTVLFSHQYGPGAMGTVYPPYPPSDASNGPIYRQTNELLSSDLDYRPPNQTQDLQSSRPEHTTIPLIRSSIYNILARSPAIQPPPTPRTPQQPLWRYYVEHPWDNNNPQRPQPVDLRQVFADQPAQPQRVPLKWQIPTSDGGYRNNRNSIPQNIPATEKLKCEVQGYLQSSQVIASAPSSVAKRPRCPPCTLAHSKCTYSNGGTTCDQCTKKYNTLDQAVSSRALVSTIQPPRLFIDAILFFDMHSTKSLLTSLRQEAENLTGFRNGTSLEDYFKGSIVCHMDYSLKELNGYSVTGVPVVITHLATTEKAYMEAKELGHEYPAPGLNQTQMDSFIDAGRTCDLGDLSESDLPIIVTALRCCDCLAMLGNWNSNSICFEGICSIPHTKNLVLEKLYSIAFRIQQLLKLLLYQVNQSLLGVQDQDPATVSFALKLVYQSIDAFNAQAWYAKVSAYVGKLQALITFLQRLHAGAPAALKAIDRYRINLDHARCSQGSQKIKTFMNIIKDRAKDKSSRRAVSFTYQHYDPGNALITRPEYSRQSYTAALEACILDWDAFEVTSRSVEPTLPPNGSTQNNPMQREQTETPASYPKFISLESMETVSAFDDTQDNEDDCAVPSLTMDQTLSESDEISIDAQIRLAVDAAQLAENKVQSLKSLKSKLLPPITSGDIHADWVGPFPRVGPSLEEEKQSRKSKILQKSKGNVHSSIDGSQHQKKRTHKSPEGKKSSHHTSGLPDRSETTKSPAIKRARIDQQSKSGDPGFPPAADHAFNGSSWADHEFNFDFYSSDLIRLNEAGVL